MNGRQVTARTRTSAARMSRRLPLADDGGGPARGLTIGSWERERAGRGLGGGAREARGRARAARAAAGYSALPPRRRDVVQDSALALGLAVLNLLAVLP